MPQPFLPFVPSSHVSNQHQDFFSSFFLFLIYFNWRLIALRYCGGFCHTFTSISHGRTCVPHPDPPTSLPIPSLRVIPVHQPRAPCLMHRTWTGDLLHVSMPFSQIIPPSPSPTESKRLLYISVALAVSHIGLSLPSF